MSIMTSVCDIQKDSVDINSSRRSKVRPYGPHGNGLTLYPVSVNKSGEGLPYAPEDFPNPGDKWRWKVGKRIAISGYFLDRYVYLPRRLCQHGRTKGFASRLSLEQYVREKFPNTDVRRFFASFIWKIPSKQRTKDDKDMFRPPGEITEDIGKPRCKAGNKFCSSLNARDDSVSSRFVFCDICCEEPGFCRDCCCILCCRVFDKAYSYIRCEANVEGSTCGHSCHVDCALRAYMAGTVGGSIGLDAEYYCRRCDSKTDLVSYVTNLLENCESVASRDDIEKILRLGICVLRGSQKTSANELLRLVELAMSKLKNGTYLEDIWKDDITQDIAG
ncbi:hypothetical protein OROGR_015664 [Orobanche gracilis]